MRWNNAAFYCLSKLPYPNPEQLQITHLLTFTKQPAILTNKQAAKQ